MSDTKYYVYEHWRSDKNEPFYVGKGQKRRAYQMKTSRNDYHRFIQEKLQRIGASVIIKIVMTNLTEIEAFLEETKRIIFWRNSGATLANFTEGGEGFSGGKHTEEWKKARSERSKAMWSDPNYRKRTIAMMTGRKMTVEQKLKYVGPKSPQHIQAIKIAAKNRKKPVPRTAEHKEHFGIAMRKAWDKRLSNPIYIDERDKRRGVRHAERIEKKRLATEKKHFEVARQRFVNFVYALIDGTERQCSRCRMTCAPEEFTRTNQGPRGLSYICKPCCAKAQDELRKKKESRRSGA